MTKADVYKKLDKKIAECDIAIENSIEAMNRIKRFLKECKKTKKRLQNLRNQVEYRDSPPFMYGEEYSWEREVIAKPVP